LAQLRQDYDQFIARGAEVLIIGPFVDRQVRGPFRVWVHRHLFTPVDATTTEVIDEVQAELRARFITAAIVLMRARRWPRTFTRAGRWTWLPNRPGSTSQICWPLNWLTYKWW
jgi:hypothetical protein